MAFVSLEDMAGTIEVTVFADLYRQSRELIESGEPIVVSGTRNGENENPRVLASEIHRLADAQRQFCSALRITITTTGVDPSSVKELKSILSRRKGRVPIKIHVVMPNRTETVINLPSTSCDPSDGLIMELHKTFGPQSAVFE